MSALIQDLRFLGRLVRRSPSFYALVVLTLGLGIGANLAVFTVANSVLLTPLPYHEPDRLVAIWDSNIAEGKPRERVAPPNFADYMEVFADAAAWWPFDVNLTDTAGTDPLRVSAVECTANLFTLLGVSPALGPGFHDTDQLFSPNLAAVISDRLWRSRYNADPGIIGRQVTLNGNPYTVTGVMAGDFDFPRNNIDVWQRQSWDLSRRTRYAHFMEAIGRLHPDTSLEQTQTQLTAISERLALEHPASNEDWRARLVPLHEEIVGAYGSALLVLLGAVALLLLLAAVNVANLLLSRARLRQAEMAIRAALGAAKGRLLQLTLVEASALGCAGALLGALLGAATVYLLLATRPFAIPRLSEVGLHPEVLTFAVILTLITIAVATSLPTIRLLTIGIRPLLQEQRGADRRQARRLLVVAETALAMTLLIGAGLMIRSVKSLLAIDPGFSPGHTVTVTVELPATLYTEWPDVAQLYHEALEQISTHPAITAAGAANFLPLKPAWIVPYTVPDRPEHQDGETLRAQYVTASAGFVEALRISLLAGRTFSPHDAADSPPAIVVNEAMARRTWSSPANAVGKQIRAGTSGFGPLGRSLVTSGGVYEVIGVVADTANNGLEGTIDPTVYFTLRQFPYRTMAFVARGDGPPAYLVSIIREAVHQLDPNLPLSTLRTLDDLLAEDTARPRFVMYLLIGFALVAVILATIGVYGVLSCAVTERNHELAIRSSLGATPGEIRHHVMGEGLTLTAIGIVLGSVLALSLSRFMSAVLFQVSHADPPAFVLATLVIGAASLAAAFLPARRAAHTNLTDALRVE